MFVPQLSRWERQIGVGSLAVKFKPRGVISMRSLSLDSYAEFQGILARKPE